MRKSLEDTVKVYFILFKISSFLKVSWNSLREWVFLF